MAKKCQCCEIRENYHYWLDFPSTNHQFIVIIAHNFLQELKIPQKFIDCFKEELSTWCTLIGSNENKWRVKFVSGTKFSDGWEKFVSDHGVEVNDIVVFHYAGDSSFKVSVFDGENGCEREGSHFASNTSSSSHKATCTSTLHFNSADNNNGSSTSTPAPAPDPAAPAAAAAVGSSQKPIVVDEEDNDPEYDSASTVETSEKDDDDQDESEYQPVWRRRTRARSYYSTTGNRKTPPLSLCYISNRRDPTDEEKNKAFENATRFMEAIGRQNKIQSAPMFQITLKHSHVTKQFKLVIPNKWAVEHMDQDTRDVKLQVGNQSWVVGYRWSTDRPGKVRRYYFNPNWASFVFDNNLEVHDSCVFELIQKGCSPVFNVYIFRAIYNIVPLTRSGYRPKAKRKIE